MPELVRMHACMQLMRCWEGGPALDLPACGLLAGRASCGVRALRAVQSCGGQPPCRTALGPNTGAFQRLQPRTQPRLALAVTCHHDSCLDLQSLCCLDRLTALFADEGPGKGALTRPCLAGSVSAMRAQRAQLTPQPAPPKVPALWRLRARQHLCCRLTRLSNDARHVCAATALLLLTQSSQP